MFFFISQTFPVSDQETEEEPCALLQYTITLHNKHHRILTKLQNLMNWNDFDNYIPIGKYYSYLPAEIGNFLGN